MAKIKISVDCSAYPGCDEDIGKDKVEIDYPRCEEDATKAYMALAQGNKNRYERLMMMVYKKQRIYNGDRSHPRLVALDKLVDGISYTGWESDKEKAETMHLEWENVDNEFYNLLKGMGNKQRVLVDGDRSELAKLDSLALSASYPDWKEDFKRAEYAYFAGFDFRFQRLVQMMEKKERAHVGDRTHPRLVELDSLALVLSYTKWEEDFRTAEESHMNWEEDANKGTYWYQSFWHIFDKMKEKQNARRKKKTQGGICSGEEEQETELGSKESEMDIIGNVGPKGSELDIIGNVGPKGSELDIIGNVGPKESEMDIIGNVGPKESEMDIIGNLSPKESEREIVIGSNKTDVDAPDEESHLSLQEERDDIGSTLQEREQVDDMIEGRTAEESQLISTRAEDVGDDRDRNFIITQNNQQPNAHLVVENNQLLDSSRRSVLKNNPPQVEAEMMKTDNNSKKADTITYTESIIDYINKADTITYTESIIDYINKNILLSDYVGVRVDTEMSKMNYSSGKADTTTYAGGDRVEAEMTKTDNSSEEADITTYTKPLIDYFNKNIPLSDIDFVGEFMTYKKSE